jgi:hypothetical protein
VAPVGPATVDAAPLGPVGPVAPITGEITKFHAVPVQIQVCEPEVNKSFTDGELGKSIAAIFYLLT